MVKQCAVILICLVVGEAIVGLTGCKIPGSIIGMIFLTLMLQLRVVKVKQVEAVSKVLLANLGFFFVPAGVGLMLYFDLIARDWQAIVLSSAISTALVIVATGKIHQSLRQHGNDSK